MSPRGRSEVPAAAASRAYDEPARVAGFSLLVFTPDPRTPTFDARALIRRDFLQKCGKAAERKYLIERRQPEVVALPC